MHVFGLWKAAGIPERTREDMTNMKGARRDLNLSAFVIGGGFMVVLEGHTDNRQHDSS